MKTWKTPVSFEMCGYVFIEVENLSTAMDFARDVDGVLPLPDDKNYVDGSWSLSCDEEEEIRIWYNNGQLDETTLAGQKEKTDGTN